MQSSQDKGGDQPRLKHLKDIEGAMIEQFAARKIMEETAPEHGHLSFEEKNKGKYMCTFPFPYMNGYLHLGKSRKTSPSNLTCQATPTP